MEQRELCRFEHFVLLSGDFEDIYRSAEGTFLLINGCIFVRKDDAEDVCALPP